MILVETTLDVSLTVCMCYIINLCIHVSPGVSVISLFPRTAAWKSWSLHTNIKNAYRKSMI